VNAVATAGPTFDQINRNAQVYPVSLLPQGGTALALFCAGFHGWNDVVHMARKEMDVTCVDVDSEKLWEMACVYPKPWEYHVDDAWEFACHALADGRKWDVVSVDPFMGDAADKCRDYLMVFCGLATSLVTMTIDLDRPMWAPPGWMAYVFARNSRVGWMVLRRA